MMKLTAPPAFIVTLSGISVSLTPTPAAGSPTNRSSADERSGSFGSHCPKLTVAFASGPSAAVAEEAIRPIPHKVKTPIINVITFHLVFLLSCQDHDIVSNILR